MKNKTPIDHFYATVPNTKNSCGYFCDYVGFFDYILCCLQITTTNSGDYWFCNRVHEDDSAKVCELLKHKV